ncbi:TPA: hypothetical protein ACSVZR_003523 [Bacillus cereus]
MATAPVITSITQSTANGGVTLNFTSSGASNEILSVERMTMHRSSTEWAQVRVVTRGTLTNVIDYTAPTGDIQLAYRIKATNANGSGAVYSAVQYITLTCLDFSSVAKTSETWNPLIMKYATSRSGDRGRQTSLHRFAGRTYPVREQARQYEEKVQVEWYVETYTEVLDFYATMVDNDFWYRDNSGRSFHASTENLNVSDHPVLNGFTCSATLTRIDGGINN